MSLKLKLDMRHLVIDVQVLLIASGRSDPPDDGSNVALLNAMHEADAARLVWDQGGLIKSQYENKLGETSFARQWLEELILARKVVEVERCRLTKKKKLAIKATGLVGEDLNYYVRTAASSPDRKLVSHDTDYDAATRKVLKKTLGISVCSAEHGQVHCSEACEGT